MPAILYEPLIADHSKGQQVGSIVMDLSGRLEKSRPPDGGVMLQQHQLDHTHTLTAQARLQAGNNSHI